MITLLAINGRLHTRQSDIVDALMKKHFTSDPILVVRYDAGDCDTIRWPNPDEEHLRSALFDDREMGIIPDVRSVLLPDGKEFVI